MRVTGIMLITPNLPDLGCRSWTRRAWCWRGEARRRMLRGDGGWGVGVGGDEPDGEGGRVVALRGVLEGKKEREGVS